MPENRITIGALNTITKDKIPWVEYLGKILAARNDEFELNSDTEIIIIGENTRNFLGRLARF